MRADSAIRTSSDASSANNYGGSAEFDADEEAVYLLYDSGYDGASMRDVLLTIAAAPGQHAGAAHAAPSERAARLSSVTATFGGRADPAGKTLRAARFRK